MIIKAFFLLPVSDDDFIRIGENPDTYENFVREIASIKSQIKEYSDFELIYDSENIESFLRKANTIVGGRYLSNCSNQLRTLFGKRCRNTSINYIRKSDCAYIHWDLDLSKNITANSITAELAESKLIEKEDENIILVNISNAYPIDRDIATIIKDALHYNDLPKLVSVPIANNEIEFSEWLLTISNNAFSLRDKSKFSRTTFKWNKQNIFINKETGHYWYFDYFHKDNKRHYEVFDETGNHLGEASENGILMSGTISPQKKITKVIR